MERIEGRDWQTASELLQLAVELGASDVHISVDIPPVFRINGKLAAIGERRLSREDTLRLVKEVMTEEQFTRFKESGELDFSYSVPGFGRFRVNTYFQRGSAGMAVRAIPFQIPSLEQLGLPSVVKELAMRERGLVIVTGPTGSGKSTTLASMIDLINNTRDCHIMTLEDPIEYLHRHKKSIVNQREVGFDTKSFANGLRAALRQDPDVILVGEMRDLETISTAVTAAETGHLVLATLHTSDAPGTIDRIIDVFPPYQQQQIRIQLAATLQGVIAQQLVPTADGRGRVAAVEVLIVNSAVRNLIREQKTHQIYSIMQTNARLGMQTMDFSLRELYYQGKITLEEAIKRALDPDNFLRLVNGM
ncbi:MAG: type IV pilus twitching motility protein PilT [Bacillota bacterium]